MTNKHTNRTLNHYIKSPEARFLIRTVAFVGYIVLGAIWWILYGLTTVFYQLICELIETLFTILETCAAVRYKLKQLHKRFSYFEMIVTAIGTIAVLAVLGCIMYFLLFSFTVIIPTGY